MATLSALPTLIELAVKDSDEAAKKLGDAIRVAEEAEKKLSLLIGYRDEYAGRFQSSLASGLAAMEYRNFQLFIEKLDNAVASQQMVVLNTKRQIDHERRAWQACERKRLSYGTLATRAEKAQQHHENKRDQKQMDEFAARSALFKR